MTHKDEPGLGTILCELGFWFQKQAVELLWGTVGLKKWIRRHRSNEPQDINFKITEPQKLVEESEPIDDSKELVSRVKAFANCPMLGPAQVESILDHDYKIIGSSIYRRTWFGDYTNHRDVDVDSNEPVPWNIAILYMIDEMEKYNKGKSYTIEEVEDALFHKQKEEPKLLDNMSTTHNCVKEAQEIKYHHDSIEITPKYHTVYGIRFMSHLTPHKLVMFKNHYILVLKAINTMNESSFIMKDLPLNDALVAKLIKNKFPIVKVTKNNEQ